jgi:hypothetical protein
MLTNILEVVKWQENKVVGTRTLWSIGEADQLQESKVAVTRTV